MALARHALVMVAVLGAPAFAGCGSSSDKGTDAPKGPGPASTSPVAKRTATPASSSSSPRSVAIKDFDYAPKTLDVPAGTKVTWTNKDAANHTVTFDTGAKKDLGSQSQGASKTFTFKKTGQFAYHCDFHPNMHGTVAVR